MNLKAKSKTILAALLVGVLAASACASMHKKTGVQQSEKANAAMQDVENDMKQMSTQIDTTKASLDDVMRVGQSPTSQPSQVKSSFKTYKTDVSKMNDLAKKLSKDIDTMHVEGNAYTEQWARQAGTYTNPELQKLSEQRRVQLRNSFTNIASASAGMRGTLNSYLSELKQIQDYLSNDLSATGIQAISSTASAAEMDGDQLKLAFNPIHAAIQEAMTGMTPGGAAAGGGLAPGGGSTGGTGNVEPVQPTQPTQPVQPVQPVQPPVR